MLLADFCDFHKYRPLVSRQACPGGMRTAGTNLTARYSQTQCDVVAKCLTASQFSPSTVAFRQMVKIELFPTQTETDGLFVIVLASTGITYTNQCGGTGCDQMEAEGYLVPVGRPNHLDAVKYLFHQRFGESCWCDGRLVAHPDFIEELERVIVMIDCWVEDKALPLALDMDRLSGSGEAWVSVKTCFGPGWLTWTNSD